MAPTNRTGPNETRGPATSGIDRPASTSAAGEPWWRERISGVVKARTGRVSDSLQAVAETVRRAGEPLQDEPFTKLGGYAGEAARAIDRVARELRGRELDELAEDVRGFARSRPAAFVGAGLAVGLAAGRFLKSSSAASDRSARGGSGSEADGSRPAGRRSAATTGGDERPRRNPSAAARGRERRG